MGVAVGCAEGQDVACDLGVMRAGSRSQGPFCRFSMVHCVRWPERRAVRAPNRPPTPCVAAFSPSAPAARGVSLDQEPWCGVLPWLGPQFSHDAGREAVAVDRARPVPRLARSAGSAWLDPEAPRHRRLSAPSSCSRTLALSTFMPQPMDMTAQVSDDGALRAGRAGPLRWLESNAPRASLGGLRFVIQQFSHDAGREAVAVDRARPVPRLARSAGSAWLGPDAPRHQRLYAPSSCSQMLALSTFLLQPMDMTAHVSSDGALRAGRAGPLRWCRAWPTIMSWLLVCCQCRFSSA